MDFTLAHGTANDFVVIADLAGDHVISADLARALCDRRRGPGGDGVLRLGPSSADADVLMDHRNADGTTAKMCGNGVRVVAKHMLDHGLLSPGHAGDRDVVRVETRSGIKVVRVVSRHPDGTVAGVAVDMGPPAFAPLEVPFITDDPEPLKHTLHLDDPGLSAAWGKDAIELVAVSMGNPHAVVLVDAVAEAPVAELGPWVATHPRFPEGANAGFVEVVARDTVRLRVHERGVGETHACGTGACAAVVALQRQGLVDAEVAVHLPGGTLVVAHVAGGSVIMTGPAVEVAHGVLDTAWLAAVAPGDQEEETP